MRPVHGNVRHGNEFHQIVNPGFLGLTYPRVLQPLDENRTARPGESQLPARQRWQAPDIARNVGTCLEGVCCAAEEVRLS